MNLQRKMWEILDSYRGNRIIDQAAVMDAILELGTNSPIDLGQALRPVLSMHRREMNHFIFPKALSDLINELSGGYGNKDILIPWPDIGLLPLVIEDNNPKSLSCLTINQEHHSFLEELLTKTKGILSDPFQWLQSSENDYDLIVGNTPFALRTREDFKQNGIVIKNDYSECLIAASLDKLRKGGKAIFVVAPSVLAEFPNPNSLKYNLGAIGAKLCAVIDLPRGTWGNLTHIPSHLIVLEKGEQQTVFSGLYSNDEKQQRIIVGNYKDKKNGKLFSDGVWENFSNFKGYSQLEIAQRIERIAKQAGLLSKNINDIVRSINIIDVKKANEFHEENSVYIPRSGNGKAVSSPDDIREVTRNLIQIIFNHNEVDAHYFSNFLNNSTLGQLFRESISRGVTIPSVSKRVLTSSNVYLPSIEIQKSVIETQLRINELKSELNETQERIWERPNSIEEFDKKIESVNKEEGFIDWVETLPFPIASILWSYHTQCNTEKEKYEKLLHFFEATTEFMAIIHLSVVNSNENLVGDLHENLSKQLSQNNMRLEMATFGVWLTVFEFLAKSIRKSLNSKEDREFILSSYGMLKFELMNSFLDKGLVGIFKEANLTRNTWLGHTGAVGDSQASQIHSNLKDLLSKFRTLTTGVWDYYQVVLPENFKYLDGVHQCEARKIMGTRTPFEKVEIITKTILEHDKLHLYSGSSQKAIELMPFVRVMPSPKTESDACYFYNRIDSKSGEARYISYHYEGDPEQLMSSDSLQSAIDKITK